LLPTKPLKIADGFGGVTSSQSDVSLLEQGLLIVSLCDSKLAADGQNRRDRQQSRGKTEHNPKHSRSEKEDAGISYSAYYDEFADLLIVIARLPSTACRASVAVLRHSLSNPDLPRS